METAYIALGSNLPSPVGTPSQTLDAAILRLAELGRVIARSSYYATEPVGYADQPMFLNAAVALETTLEPLPLLDRLLAIEQSFGRERGIPNGPRTLDLDLLLYGELIRSTVRYRVPRPDLLRRIYMLQPLAELAPDLIHPESGLSIAAHCARLLRSEPALIPMTLDLNAA